MASVGPALAHDLALAPAWAREEPGTLTFGALDPLVGLMVDTPRDRLLPALVEKTKGGTELRTLVAAAALANARAFGGQDYVGYHSFMALVPAFEMARELPQERRPLPVLKVLYRNTSRIQAVGGKKHEVLHPVVPAEIAEHKAGGELLREATRRRDMEGAERTFAALARGPAGEAFNHLQFAVQDEVDVHRIVLAWRAWAALDLTGKEQAHTLLRQSVRYCVDAEQYVAKRPRPPGIRALLPKLLDQYGLLEKTVGDRKPDDAWVEQLSRTVYGGNRDRAADAVAAALAEGMAPEAVGEAISLAANRLVLCDPGRTEPEDGKPKGSIHGASVGVHASDSANAWRNIARVSNHRNTVASLIAGAYHTAGQNGGQNPEPLPRPEQLEAITTKDPDRLLQMADAAIKEKDQARACALVQRYGDLGQLARPVFDLLLRYAVSEDGALHAEKYYRTVTEEFAATRPAFRWRHLAALARVTASEFGFPAPGFAEACRLLEV
jgi:hypothetical protein